MKDSQFLEPKIPNSSKIRFCWGWEEIQTPNWTHKHTRKGKKNIKQVEQSTFWHETKEVAQPRTWSMDTTYSAKHWLPKQKLMVSFKRKKSNLICTSLTHAAICEFAASSHAQITQWNWSFMEEEREKWREKRWRKRQLYTRHLLKIMEWGDSDI